MGLTLFCSASVLAQKIEEKTRMRESVSIHPTGLTPNLLRLFQARPAPPYVEPIRRKKPLLEYSGVAEYVTKLAEPGTSEHKPEVVVPEGRVEGEERLFINPEVAYQCRVDGLTRLEQMVAKVREKLAAREKKIEEAAAGWDPEKDPNVEGEPLKTLFVANLSGDVSERKLKREFEEYGPIKRIRLVHDKYSGKPKGYAFIEFEHKSDMKEAYKVADGTRIEGKRCLVDVERGRTVPGWRPKRLGGGKSTDNGVKKLPKDVNKHSVLKLVYKNLGMETSVHDTVAKTEAVPREDRFVDRPRDRPRDDFRPAPRMFDRERDDRQYGRHRKRDRSSDRSGDRRHRSRDRYGNGDRERYSRKRERSPYSRDDRYAAIPPPESLGGPPSRPDLDEPEEGEYHP